MKKRLLLLLTSLIVSVLACDRTYGVVLVNQSNNDVYMVVDLNPIDDVITSGSEVVKVSSKSKNQVYRLSHFGYSVKDSMHVYLLDAQRVDSKCPIQSYYIKESHISNIESDMILLRMTILQSVLWGDYYTLTYPPKENMEGVRIVYPE